MQTEANHFQIIRQSAEHALESATHYLLTNGQPNRTILSETFKDIARLAIKYYNDHVGKGTNPRLDNFIKDIHAIHKKHYPIHDWDNFETLRLWNAINYQIKNSRILFEECIELKHHDRT